MHTGRLMRVFPLVVLPAVLGGCGLTKKFQAGDGVFTVAGPFNVRARPSLAAATAGAQPGNASGIVAAGPVRSDGFTWWKIDFDAGADGWFAEGYLTQKTHGPLPPLPSPSAPRPGLLRVSPNQRFLITADGTPFFWMGDTAWFLPILSPADIDAYFTDAARKGFNVTQIDLCFYYLGGRRGYAPFLNDDPANPDAGYWEKIDWLVSDAERRGMYVALTVMWADSYKTLFGGDTDKAQRLGRWLGDRYGSRNNVVWIVSGEYQEIANPEKWAGKERPMFDAMARGIREGGAGQLMTIHPMGPTGPPTHTSSADFHECGWLDFNMIQSGIYWSNDAFGYPENHAFVAHDYALSPVKPVLEGESIYEDPPAGLFAAPSSSSSQSKNPTIGSDVIRRKAYWAVFAGSFGYTYGYVKKALPDAPGRSQMRHLRSLLESRPLLDRIPDQSLLRSAPGAGIDHVQATRAADGSYAWIYLPTGGRVTVDMAKLQGSSIKASWYNPRDGRASSIGQLQGRAARSFESPGPPGPGNDWVLVLDASGVS